MAAFPVLLALQAASALLPSPGIQRVTCSAHCMRRPKTMRLAASSPGDSLPCPPTSNRLLVVAANVQDFVERRFFLVGVVGAVALAAVVPDVGREGGILHPELSVAWGATCGIFLLAGLSLPTTQFKVAALQWREHALIQSFSFIAIPLAMSSICAALDRFGLLGRSLLDGMLVMAALPTTVNMCVALTRSSNCNEALAIFNAALGNILGVVLTPTLLLLLLGRTVNISIVDTLQKADWKSAPTPHRRAAASEHFR